MHDANDDQIWIDVKLNDKRIAMQIDTGAKNCVISDELYKKLFSNVKLIKDNTILQTYSGEVLSISGSMNAIIEYNGMSRSLSCIVVKNG